MMTGHLFGQSVQDNGKPCRILHVFSGVPTGRHADSAAQVASVSGVATNMLRNRLTGMPHMQPITVPTHTQSDQLGTGHSYRFDLTVSDSPNNLGSTARWSIEREGKPAAAKLESRSHISEYYRKRGRE